MDNLKQEVGPYTLKSTTDGFTARAKNVFDCLQNLEDKHNAYEKARKDTSSEDESDQGILKEDPCQADTETIKPAFKKPPQRGHSRSFQSRRPFKRSTCNRMPDFNDGPVKWKRYSLEDVDDISDSSNKQAAYAFLEERRKQREGEITEAKVDVQSTACSKGQFTFSKKVKETKQIEKEINLRKSDESNSQKLGFVEDETDNNGDNGESSKEKQTLTTFKSRKSGKRNIRARNTKEENEDDT